MNLNPSLRKALALLLMSGSLGWMMAPARSAPLTISEYPLFLTTNVPPNVIVTLDDSGSMSRAFTPDVCGNPNAICDNNPDASLNHRYLKSSHYNPIYYNPKVTYRVPVDASGTELATSFNKAWVNGYAHTLPGIDPDFFDLATQYRPTAGLFLHSGTKSHQFMNHYTAAADLTKPSGYASHVHTGPIQGSKSGSDAPRFTINDYVNHDGSGGTNNPGSNLISVTVNGTASTRVGAFSGTCNDSMDPGNNYEFKTKVVGSDLTLCFRDSNTMWDKTVVVTHKLPGSGTQPVTATDPTAAYYYVFNEGNSGCGPGTDAQKKVDNDCYTVRIVSTSSGADRDGDGSISASEADERQNFANWYSFYRTRNLATIAGASLAFQSMDESNRVAWQSLHTCRGSTSSLVTADCEGWETTSTNFSNAIKPFTGTHKQDFYTWLFRLNTNTNTPLHEAMKRAGDYFSTTGENSPYDDDLATSGTVTVSSGQLSCRKNFHILMTDGIWSDTSVSAGGNLDGTLPAPYKDGNSDSLADLAYKYWSTDLTGLTDNLLPYIVESGTGQTNNAKNDPATWQHMVNFTVGLGLTPFLESTGLTWGGNTYSGSYPTIAGGTQAWPSTANNAATDDGRVADLWHAAINSRGKFFSVDTPGTLVNAFVEVKNAIEEATPSAAALAANSTSTQVGALVYQAVFNSKDWSGDLKAFQIGFGGVVAGTPNWSAASNLPAAGSRNIFTFDGSNVVPVDDAGNGVNFNWAVLSSAQQGYLNTNASGVADANGANRLDWLRGVQSKEAKNGGIFRNRTTVLGDIINSDPVFAQKEDFGYADMVAGEASSYKAYVEDKAGHTPAVFVGGNDGMLHAFHAGSGVELFAYVPNAVYPNLSKLTDPTYSHQYFVDGGPSVGDAYLSTGWNTVLLGGLGGGGKSIYALNVSNAASPSASMVMWEFTDEDLGLTYSKPQIARLNSGQWVAIFGNGYNSAAEKAFLYVVNLETGELIKKIAAGSATSNGLSTPVLYDANADMIMDYAYAGDLQGNLWKFDLTSFADQTTPQFIARNASNQVQAITAQPILGGHPNGGVLLYFGTGQYLQSTDVLSTKVQTFYGIWDKGTPVLTTNRSELQQQAIVASTTEFGKDLRETTTNTLDWASKLGWYMDLNQSAGERVVSHALLRYGRVVFVTVVPSTDTCDAGGTSWIMDLNAVTGARATDSNYDFNNDKSYDTADYLASGATASGFKTTVGISKTPAWFEGVDIEGNKTGTDYMVWTGTLGGTESIGTRAPGPGPGPGPGSGALRRVYWLQIQ